MKYSIDEIKEFVAANKSVRINMHLRAPMYGRLVSCNDYEEMLAKGFIRFVMESRVDLFEGNSPDDTQKIYKGNTSIAKLISIKEITYIK